MNMVRIAFEFSAYRADRDWPTAYDHITRNEACCNDFKTEDDARSFFTECREAIEKIELAYKDRREDAPFDEDIPFSC